MHGRVRIAAIASAIAAGASWPSAPVEAANGLRPRTPAVFGEVPCMTTVDAGTVMQVDYTVPGDDTELTPEELPDSRQMQFFALRTLPFDFKLPTYINQSDLDRAEANGDNTMPYGPDDVLRGSSAWPAGSFVAITPDDARLPITTAQAAMGVAWDTTDVAPGPWFIAGYTWEPEKNLWSFRLGAVRVVDAADPDAAGPAASFTAEGQNATAPAGTAFDVTACVAAAPGSTYTASIGVLEGIDEPTWVPFAEDVAIDGETIALSPVLPAEAVGGNVKFRLEVTDPNGKQTVVYSPFPLTVLAGAADAGGDDAGDDDGGRCSVGRRPPPPAVMLGLLALGLARRRRRASTTSPR